MKRGLVKAALLAATFVTSPATAALVLDQSNIGSAISSGNGAQVHNFGQSVEAGQSFIAGIAGTLGRIDLMANFDQANVVTLWIRPIVGGIIDPDNADALGSVNFLAHQWASGAFGRYDITSVDVSALSIGVTAGQQLAITLSTSNPAYGGWHGPTADNYAGGTGWGRGGTSSPWGSPIGISQDLYFATYVDVAAVPEPASWAMLIAGFGIVGGAMRKRKENAVLA